MFIPDPDLDILPIPDPGGQKGTGSRIRIRNSDDERKKFLKKVRGKKLGTNRRVQIGFLQK
jgi:hypothetical protein